MSDKIVSETGEIHLEDEVVDLSGLRIEAWIAIGLLWLLGVTVFHQFFTRYVLNDSAAWTEEIARYLLIAVVFIGASIGIYKNNHIQVDMAYRYLPQRFGRHLSTLVDAVRVVFFGLAIVLTAQMMLRIGGNIRMTAVNLPMNVVYGVCLLAFAAMFVRSLQIATLNFRRGYSVLERPEIALEGIA
jgi:TRAP-type C4-dicarboxylate transport system permease small subunit